MATKTYKKFLTGAATAAMVVSAVAPVAAQGQDVAETANQSFTDIGPNSSHFLNVTEARELGFLSGYDDGTFKPNKILNRGDVTKMLGKYVVATSGKTLSEYVEENKIADVENFADVPNDARDKELVTYSKIVKHAGIFEGSNNNLMPTKEMNRDQIAVVLVRAFDLKDDTSKETKVIDGANSGYVKEIEILLENGVSDANPYKPFNKTSRAQFASFLVRAYKVSQGWDPGEELPEIEAVNKLDDITIKVGQTPSLPTTVGVTYSNGSTGTAKVEWDTSKLDNSKVGTYALTGDVAGTDLTASVNVIVEKDELGTVTEAAITTKYIDDALPGQFIDFTVNGKKVSVETLVKELGYQVEFQADKDVFTDDSAVEGSKVGFTSVTGEIDPEDVEINDTFNVKIVLKKDGNVVQSENAAVTVINMDATPEIGGMAFQLPNKSILSSNKLVTDETYTFAGLESKTGDIIGISGTPVFKTSNPAIATVDEEGTITPVAPGAVTITATAGDKAYSTDFEVTNTKRTLGSVTSVPSSLHIAPGKDKNTAGPDTTLYLNLKDQYGDSITLGNSKLKAEGSDGLTVEDLTADGAGKAKVTVSAAAGTTAGTYNVYFYDQNEKNVGKIPVNVSVENTPASYKLEVADPREDNKIGVKKSVKLVINQYTQKGSFAGIATDEGLTVAPADDKIASATLDKGIVTVKGLKAGSTDIEVKNANGTTVATYKVIVESTPVVVTKVNWKNAPTVVAAGEEIAVDDVLSISPADPTGVDRVVTGIEVNATTTSPIRITSGNLVYLDGNDDGYNNSQYDIALGTIALSADPASNFFEKVTGTTYATEEGNEGTIIFTFSNSTGVIASTTVGVAVPTTATEDTTPAN